MKTKFLAAAAFFAFFVYRTPVAFADRPTYFVDPAKLPFEAIREIDPDPGNPGEVSERDTQRFWGIEAGAGYQIEVPPDWNGKLVLYAHGFVQDAIIELTVQQPRIRKYLVDNGYAWAASSYSKNGYDVKRGVLDTEALNQVFQARVGVKPTSTYITGHSMGGHITGVLIESFPNSYVGAVPMCGVMGDESLFDFFLDYNLVAQALAGVRATFPPPPDYLTAVVPRVIFSLGGPSFPLVLNEQGRKLRAATELLSGGIRPSFNETYPVWALFLFGLYLDGTFNGITSGNVATNVGRVYRFMPDGPFTPDEVALNQTVLRVPADPVARFFHGADNLENIPPVRAVFQIPVLSLHTIGDLFVPISMEQIYARRAASNGRSGLLVQRAYRDAGHCGFTVDEEATAFADLVDWVEKNIKPSGDPILDPAAVADPEFGCQFTQVQRPPYTACSH
jgi:pimeloyl-ACP methyl ester carboxylesterase